MEPVEGTEPTQTAAPQDQAVDQVVEPSKDEVPQPDLSQELMKQRKLTQEMESRVKDSEQKMQTMKEDKLKHEGNFQALAEEWQGKATDAETKLENFRESYINEKKMSVVREAALRAGISKLAMQDLELLDLSEVDIEHTSKGNVNILGAEVFVERQKTQRPYWFTQKNIPNFSHDNVGVTSAREVDMTAVIKAEKEARKSGDRTEYNRVFAAYQQKQKALRRVK